HITTRVNPRIAAGFAIAPSTRLHGAFGTGIRPPGGIDLAFTNNPALKPQHTFTVDGGVERQLGSRLSVDATYCYTRYTDLILSLAGQLARLGQLTPANPATSRP